jgi:hypothetical protein
MKFSADCAAEGGLINSFGNQISKDFFDIKGADHTFSVKAG